jgi:hypothetical protein
VSSNDNLVKKSRNRHAGLDPASRTYRIYWIPAFAGMTEKRIFRLFTSPSNRLTKKYENSRDTRIFTILTFFSTNYPKTGEGQVKLKFLSYASYFSGKPAEGL